MANVILKYFLTVVAITLLCIDSFGQDFSEQQLDSLKQKATSCDPVAVSAMQELGDFYYYQNDRSQHRYYIQRIIDCVESGDDKYAIVSAYRSLLIYHQNTSGVDSTLETSRKIFSLVEKDTSSKAKRTRIETLSIIGIQYYEKMDDLETAYSYYQQAIDEAYSNQFYDLYLGAIGYVVNYYLYDMEFDKAIQLADEGLSRIPNPNIAENEPLLVKTNMDNLKFYTATLSYQKASAILYDPKRNASEKRKAYSTVLDWMKPHEDEPTYVLMVIDLILETMNEHLPLDTLLAYGNKGLQLDQMFDDSDHNLYRHHGKNLIKAGQYTEAKKLLEIALKLAEEKTDWYFELAETYDALATVHLKLGEHTKAQERFDLYKIYLDSTYTRKNRNAIENIETKYALSQKEAENLRITQEAENLSERLKLFILLGTVLFLLLALVIAFYLNQRKNAKRQKHLNEMKDKIFAILGHDLKGPSLAFNSLTKKLSYLIKKNDTERLLELAPSFEESGGRISKIINDVLNWALTENESFLNNPEKLVVLPLIKEAVHDLDLNLKEKNISVNVTVAEDVDVLFDKNAFRIINRNLIHNAIKFSPLNATINIRYNNQEEKLEYVDEGKGMDSEVIKKILNETPVESSLGTQNERGTGIGLVTCLKLAKLNNGKLSFLKNNPSGTIIKLGLDAQLIKRRS